MKKKFKRGFYIFIFISSLLLTINYLNNKNISIDNKDFVKFIISKSNYNIKYKSNIVKKVVTTIANPYNIINNNYKGLSKKVIKLNSKEVNKNIINKDALVYIYNTHQTEEYKASNYTAYSINPTVMVASYILKEYLAKNKINSIVEEGSIKEYLNNNNLKYVSSYKASRYYLENAKKNNPSLQYYIDLHRDSLAKDKTTIEINNKSYAKIIFLIGTENPNFNTNLEFTKKIVAKINNMYPNLCKGIYQKGGVGVNGVYNQDFSPTTILIEIGGSENEIDEVLNSTIAFEKAFLEVISNNGG